MSDSALAPVYLPRSQAGPNPQHLLVTLLGDYWHGRTVTIPSAALVELLGDFDISPASARSTLSRLARRGILEIFREGRSTSYRVTQEFLDAGASRAQRILQFGKRAASADQWDGRWVLVAFSIPDENRQGREMLRAQLKLWGFAPLQDGLWASVSVTEEEVQNGLQSLGVEGVAAFSSRLLHPLAPSARQALVEWPLHRAREGYDDFVARFGPVRQRATQGVIPPTEALVLRTQIMAAWRSLVRLDPDLPTELLPPDWPGNAASETFAELYDGLGPLAELRCHQIVGKHDAGLIPLTWHITTDFGTDN